MQNEDTRPTKGLLSTRKMTSIGRKIQSLEAETRVFKPTQLRFQ